MKYGCRLLIGFSLTWFACFAEEKIPTIQENRVKAEELLSQLELDLSRILSRRERHLVDSEKYLREKGVWDEEEEAWNQLVKDNKELQRHILQQKGAFVAFRDSMVEIISLNYGRGSMGEYQASRVMLEITEWYVNFLKQELME